MLSYLLGLSMLSFSYADETEEPIETTVDANPEQDTEDATISAGTASEEGSSPTEYNDEEQRVEVSTESETSVQTDADSDQEAIESLMNAIMQESAQLEDESYGDDEEEDDDDDFNLKGNFEQSYVMTLWKDVGVFHTYQFSGDPQHFFRNDKDNGFTLGVRYQFNRIERIQHRTSSAYRTSSSLLGLTTGYQLGAVRFNTAASWTWNHYFTQTETDRTEAFVTYQYSEIPAMSGVLWENTLTYAPEESEFGIQLGVGFPFQINGEREMGEAFTGSWQASSLLSIGFSQLGYTYIVYPDHVIEHIQIGSGIIF